MVWKVELVQLVQVRCVFISAKLTDFIVDKTQFGNNHDLKNEKLKPGFYHTLLLSS